MAEKKKAAKKAPAKKTAKKKEVVETVVEETTEEVTSNEVVESEVETKDATEEVTKYGTYRGNELVRIYTEVNHGEDYQEIAKAHAERDGLVAKPYFPPKPAEEEKNTVVILGPDGTQVMRVFSEKVHGEDYKEIAAAFMQKHGERKNFTTRET